MKNQPAGDISLNIFQLACLPIYSNCTRTIQELFINYKQNTHTYTYIYYTLYYIHYNLLPYIILSSENVLKQIDKLCEFLNNCK